MGLTPDQYWNSTLAEVLLYVEVYNEKQLNKQRNEAYNSYNIAYLTTLFISCSINKKEIPTIEKLFSQLFSENNMPDEEYEKKLAQFQEEQLIRNFERINKSRKKGGNK